MVEIFSKMRFFKRIRRDRSLDSTNSGRFIHNKLFNFVNDGHGQRSNGCHNFNSRPLNPEQTQVSRLAAPATAASAALVARLPEAVLERIFAFVCPHSRDETFDTCEQSALEDACMLCDLRDLAHCVAVSKMWRKWAVKSLYHSIRIDAVHYCDREIYLSEQRKKRIFDRNAEPEDTARSRVKLLCRTLRHDAANLGPLVHYLKTPYMLRESCQADLARIVHVLPNLRYVDLPEGVFTNDSAFLTLRLEVQARCLELCKMTFMNGAESWLQELTSGAWLSKLQVIELIGINMDPTVLRQVLCSLRNLRALKISDCPSINDDAMRRNDRLPPWPPLHELILNNVPHVTAEGLKAWLSLAKARKALKILTLKGTGVKIWMLHDVIKHTPNLKHLFISDTVTSPMPADVSSLASESVKTLHYEITQASSTPKYTNHTNSYYDYLACSLLSGGLPNLQALYVREPHFPEMLMDMPPPVPSFFELNYHRPRSIGSSALYESVDGGYSAQLPHILSSPQGLLTPSHATPHAPDNHSAVQGNPPGRGSGSKSSNPFALLVNGANGHARTASGTVVAPHLPALLEVFTKGDDDLDWSFVKVKPANSVPSNRSGSSATVRPKSRYGLGADVMGGSNGGWSHATGARKSVFVGAADRGFLPLPSDIEAASMHDRSETATKAGTAEDFWPSNGSFLAERKKDKLDLWR